MTGPLTAAQVAAWEREYQCKLTEDEIALLIGPPSGPVESQKRSVLIGYLADLECPACLLAVPPRAALGRPVRWGTIEDAFTCPHCRRALMLVVPVFGIDRWRLAEPVTVAFTAGELEVILHLAEAALDRNLGITDRVPRIRSVDAIGHLEDITAAIRGRAREARR